MLALIFSFFLPMTATAKVNAFLEKPPVVRQMQAQIVVERTYVNWADSHGRIEHETVCAQKLNLPVSDSRGRPRERPQAEQLTLECSSLYKDEPVKLTIRGRAEMLKPRDMDGWVTGTQDLFRIFFTLDTDLPPESVNQSKVQTMAAWEFFTEDLDFSKGLLRLSPPEFLVIQCEGDSDCHTTGPESIYRAKIDFKAAE